MIINRLIKQAMREKGMNMPQIAKRLGVTVNAVYKSMDRSPRFSTVQRYAKKLGYKVEVRFHKR